MPRAASGYDSSLPEEMKSISLRQADCKAERGGGKGKDLRMFGFLNSVV